MLKCLGAEFGPRDVQNFVGLSVWTILDLQKSKKGHDLVDQTLSILGFKNTNPYPDETK